MDPNSNGTHFLPPGVNPFVMPRFSGNPNDYPQLTGPQSNIYQPPPVHRPGGIDVHSSPTSSNQSFTSPVDYPPVTPPHLTHSRRNSRESGETSSSNSTPSSGAQGGGLVHRHKRSHASAAMSPVSPVARKSRTKPKKKDSVEDEDDDPVMSDDDPANSQKLRREDAKKSRQDAEQKRRDQLKGAYDMLRGAVPGTSEKTSKVTLVNHARLHIEKLSAEREKLRNSLSDTQQEIKGLRALNQRLMEKLMNHRIDFEEDLRATEMEIPPDDEPLADQSVLVHQQSVTPTAAAVAPAGPPPPSMPGAMPAPSHRPTHIRTSSNVSASHYQQVQIAPAPSVPMSAPSHTTSLPIYHQPPISTPSSPLKGPNQMMQPTPVGQAQGGNPNGVPPQLHIPYPGVVQVLPSPSSSASSGPRHPIYSPDGQNPMFYSDDPSSSDSGPRSSANSSHVNIHIAHMSLEEQQAYMQQQGTSTPHSPSQGMGFGAQMYPGPGAYAQPDMQYGMQGYADPGLGLQTVNGQTLDPNGHPYVVMGHEEMGGMPSMPGAFPTDEPLHYHPPPTHGGSGYMQQGAPGMGYGGEQAMEYGHPSLTLTQDGIPAGYGSHMAPADAYINSSPIPSKPPSPRMSQQQQQQQFLASPASQPTPQPGINTQLMPTPSMSHLSPHHHHPLDGAPPGHSPMPPHSPLYTDGSQRPDGGLHPTMSENGPLDGASNEATPGPSDAASWGFKS